MNNPDILMQQNAIAIIGLSCRLPGARNVHQFWQNLKDGIESISFFSDEELRASGVDPDLMSDSNYVKAGAILEDIEWFDAHFFGYTPREAELIDPQHRLFLECAWEAFEDAGYNPETYAGLIGVFSGAGNSDYLLYNIHSNPGFVGSIDDLEVYLGNNPDYHTTRVSYKLNLKGPSLSIQTACSSSLVAVNMACESLLNGQSDMAVAGGVSISLPQKKGYHYIEGSIFSPDGHCRAFDVNGQGPLFGNGVGVVVLKRLEDALEDRDHIYAVIKGYAINNDGSAKVGFTAPSVEGQMNVIGEALVISGIDPGTISYIETHGTGTPLGDPIEITALTQAFDASAQRKGSIAIGSVKTNFGHTYTAAGIASLIKTVLALKYKEIPPSLNFENPNPKIDFVNSPFYVNTRLKKWQSTGSPRRAGVSSFGVGGTNAHAIIEEAPSAEASGKSRTWQLLLLSAKSHTALDKATINLVEHLKQHPDINLADVAYTLNNGRKTFDYRRMTLCQNVTDAVSALDALDPKRVLTFFQKPTNREMVFLFSGQGSQYVNMGLELYKTEQQFQKEIDCCSEILKPHLGMDLRDIIYPGNENYEEAAENLKNTLITQPALFTIEYSLAKLWMSWGVRPTALAGHSIGEYVAACLAGVFSLEDALSLVAVRGRLMQDLPNGSMLAVSLSEKELKSILSKELSIAAVNAPCFCVVSGEKGTVRDLERELSKKDVPCRHLHTSHAFHSKMMDTVLDPFIEQAKQVNFNVPQIPIISTVTGTWVTSKEVMTPDYWAKNLRQTVRFSDCIQRLLLEPNRIFLEVGPGQTLSMLTRQHSDNLKEQIVLSSIRHPQEQKSDIAFILDTLGRLWLAGVKIDWAAFFKDEKRYRVSLPTYPFERQRYWLEPRKSVQANKKAQKLYLEKADINDWFYVPSWKRSQLPKIHGTDALPDQKECWLVFIDECEFGAKLVRQLQQDGQRVTIVKAGQQFRQISADTYTINPRIQVDYQSLIKELRATKRTPNKIVHLWMLTEAEKTFLDSNFLETSQYLGFYSLLFLMQAMDDQIQKKPIEIKVISNHLQEVTGDELLFPEKATLLGPCRVISQEYPDVMCSSIDIVLPKADTVQKELLQMLKYEFSGKVSEDVVAYRGKYRWIQSFEAISLGKSPSIQPRLRKNGVYVITGGLGGIGMVLAEYLAKTVQAKLALISRTSLPKRGEWDQWMKTQNEEDIISQKISKVQQIEKMGAEVQLLRADVSNMFQMKAAIAETYNQFGAIHGVVHAAGVPGGGIMQLKTPEMVEEVLAPKVKGTLVLEKLLNETELDFFVLCSSINSFLGGIGQADYCAANAFLDAYAHQNHTKNRTISINWCAWQEVGMAVNTAVPDDLKEERQESLKHGISPEEGKDAFSRILNFCCPQVMVSTQNLLSLVEQNKRRLEWADVEKTDKTLFAKATHIRPALLSEYVGPGNSTEKAIVEIWQELLGIENVGIHDNFFELGGHSLLATKVIARLRNEFPVEFPIASLFENPTVHLLGKMILKEQKEEPYFVESMSRGQKRKARKLKRMTQ